ncbi:RND transporter [Halarcobacter mediterraneus]|uniref:RND transporter n=1 Tax=Halarcobacter mediterraneus TaxID=2023153 RepID=A0A4Q1B2W0_9BACT|nr:TolC family protein [Halarcobacter mediterraneus]RXK13135.1 RND transporter [Halarcobacter mediterraneus]
MSIVFKSIFIFFISILFIACSTKRLDTNIKYPKLPKNFNQKDILIEEKWIKTLKDKQLLEIINKALNNNYELKQLSYDIKIKEQELISSNSLLFPSIDLNASSSKDGDFKGDNNPSSSKVSLDFQYEVDLWNKLSDSSKASNMNLLETKALYKEAKQQLITDVTLLYYEIIESNRLLDLYKKNLKTAENYYELTLSRYKQGISEALDTLLAKNSIYSQQSKITDIKNVKAQAIYKLEQLLGEYPKGKLDINKNLPILNENIKLGIPSEIIERKSSIVASWNALLSKDFTLAYTHKQRLPSLNISASIENIKNDGLPSTWSLISGLTAPIFNAGELKAKEKIAYFELKKAEFEYLNTIYSSFVEIENFIEEEKNLKDEFEILKNSNINAQKALSLSFNQYLKGLVEYTTVLNLQESLYETQASLIQIKKSLIENKINLHKALGGDFLSKEESKE